MVLTLFLATVNDVCRFQVLIGDLVIEAEHKSLELALYCQLDNQEPSVCRENRQLLHQVPMVMRHGRGETLRNGPSAMARPWSCRLLRFKCCKQLAIARTRTQRTRMPD